MKYCSGPSRYLPDILAGTRSLIFIQASKLEEFKNKKATSERDFDFNINEEFQYGESRDKSTRFLVYHDKGNQIFQVGSRQWQHGPLKKLSINCSIDSWRLSQQNWAEGQRRYSI